MGSLAGRVAVVTGAGRGLGRAYALALAAEGAAVLVNDVDAEPAQATAADVEAGGGRALVAAEPLDSVASGAALVERAVAELGGVDVVVNNAGVSIRGDVEELDDEALDAHLGVHLRATVGTTGAAFVHMRETGWGRVVNTVSGHGLQPRAPGSAAYAAVKAAVFGFTRAAALEAPHGVTVNAVAPLAFTRMSEGYLSGLEEARERFDPEHVARVVVWLCSDGGAAMQGRVLRVEGEELSEYTVEVGSITSPP